MTSPAPGGGGVPPSSRPPPPKKKNDAKFALLGLLFFGGAAGLWMASGDEPPTPPPAPPVEEVARVNPMAEPELDLTPEPEPAPAPAPEPMAEAAAEPTRERRKAPARDAWDCAGELDVVGAKRVIDQHRAQVRTCYERRLKVNSILQGSMRLKIKVGAGGEVVQSQTSGTLRDAEITQCVRKLASGWRFPAPSGGRCAVVEAPFQFAPKT